MLLANLWHKLYNHHLIGPFLCSAGHRSISACNSATFLVVSDSTTGANGSGNKINIIIWFAKYLHQFQDAYSPYWSHTFLIRSRWSFPLFLWPHCVIQGWYCKEKLDVSHSWGSNGYLHVIAYLLFLFLLPKMKGVLCFHILRFHKPEGHIWYLVPS